MRENGSCSCFACGTSAQGLAGLRDTTLRSSPGLHLCFFFYFDGLKVILKIMHDFFPPLDLS